MASASMASHLTRHVFRQLLANQPVIHRGCLRRRSYSSQACQSALRTKKQRRYGTRVLTEMGRRTFFNLAMFGGKPAPSIKDANMIPGMDKMMLLERRQRMRARLPTPAEVAQAFNEYLRDRVKTSRLIEDNQAKLLLLSIQYCMRAQHEGAEGASPSVDIPLMIEHLAKALPYTAYTRTRARRSMISSDHLGLAKILLEHAEASQEDTPQLSVPVAARVYVRILTNSGDPLQARDVLLRYEQRMLSSKNLSSPEKLRGSKLNADETGEGTENLQPTAGSRAVVAELSEILHEFASRGDEGHALETLELMRNRAGERDPIISESLLRLNLIKGDVSSAHHWWGVFWAERKLRYQEKPSGTEFMVRRIFRWCLEHDHPDFGNAVARDMMEANPSKATWDDILGWAAGSGRSVDEIDRMIDVVRSSQDKVSESRKAKRFFDVHTINALVEAAMLKSDPYRAERFVALGRQRGIEPDALTYKLQMDYRLGVNDIDGALTAYQNLQAAQSAKADSVLSVNKLLVALCKSKRHDFDTIMNVAGDLSDRRARFEPETVSQLALLHLNRDEIHDVIDLLNTHAYHFSSAERAVIREDIVAFCLDAKTPVSRAWDAYMIVREVFDELSREPRTKLMLSFFSRDRADMAVYVFNHMRMHSRVDTMPTVDTYIAAFLGAAEGRELDSLEVLHNQLKLDFNIDVNARLRNSLMLAYTLCGRPRTALSFWDEIVGSREGPSYNSIHIALRACQRVSFGDLKAQEVWQRLRRKNIELDNSLWAAYIAALASEGNLNLAVQTLEEAEKQKELEVDVGVLGGLMNVTPTSEQQAEVETWAKRKYPDLWMELEELSAGLTDDRRKVFNVNKKLEP
ncbi:hypothetical protein BAUCODRAFT_34387 [Baudoinia panamericana UAMH 10762]|uniref:Complex I intermediate-associated protein 84, mitochondrial n=1 Tax=Baudoinia panamericana (strain UAMH 10762) TaxID=717646 RepID=M2MG77_BAUPA|nr:uncharacterized protein BAUCODRAFT_34387 [Baudoinia panamericana UAMH 10762]EMC95631.1 hypothetical protein BAUCODRAFT_34387 [Baudoinia panamericana UAMH 10762]